MGAAPLDCQGVAGSIQGLAVVRGNKTKRADFSVRSCRSIDLPQSTLAVDLKGPLEKGRIHGEI
jgi:hypothetical protein